MQVPSRAVCRVLSAACFHLVSSPEHSGFASGPLMQTVGGLTSALGNPLAEVSARVTLRTSKTGPAVGLGTSRESAGAGRAGQ